MPKKKTAAKTGSMTKAVTSNNEAVRVLSKSSKKAQLVKKKAAAKKSVVKKAVVKKAAPQFRPFPSELESARVRLLPVCKEVAYARARIAMETELDKFKQTPGFLFADIGYKIKGGDVTDYLAVRIHVKEKLPKSKLADKCIDKMCLNDLVPTDVLQSNFRSAVSSTDAGSKIRSNANPNDFGTLGMAVTASMDGLPLFLTCAHVVSLIQPPPAANNDISDSPNGGAPSRIVAFSANSDERFFRFDQWFDVALLAPETSIPASDLGPFTNLPVGVRAPNRVGAVFESDLGLKVYKIGAKTGLTTGYLDSVDSTPIPMPGTGFARDHIIIRSTKDPAPFNVSGSLFADQGDSGAIVFTDDGRLIGMVRAVQDINDDGVLDRTIVTRMINIAAIFPIIV